VAYDPRSAIRDPRSAIRDPRSAIRDPRGVEALRFARHPGRGWTANDAHDGRADGELPEPAGDTPDPLDVAISHEHTRELKGRLEMLADRERQFLALQALGLTYQEIAATGASIRTVERQILRGRGKLNQSAP
jgi:DNA-directed RNA polymerase specialized sigma24 family protein